jgi:hypothetical protein
VFDARLAAKDRVLRLQSRHADAFEQANRGNVAGIGHADHLGRGGVCEKGR